MRAGGGGDGARRPDRPREPPSRRLVLEISTKSVYLGLISLLIGRCSPRERPLPFVASHRSSGRIVCWLVLIRLLALARVSRLVTSPISHARFAPGHLLDVAACFALLVASARVPRRRCSREEHLLAHIIACQSPRKRYGLCYLV